MVPLPCAVRLEQGRVVLVRPEPTTWPSPILAAPPSRPGLITGASAGPLKLSICRNKRPIPKEPPPKRDGTTKTPCRVLPRLPLGVGTPVVEQVAALSMGPATPASPPALTATEVKLWLRPSATQCLVAAVVVAPHGVHVAFPEPRPCCKGRPVPASWVAPSLATVGVPQRPGNAQRSGSVLMTAPRATAPRRPPSNA